MKRFAFLALGATLSISALVTARAQPYQLDPLWSLAPGSRTYLTTDNTQRGLAYNPVTGHVLVVNRNTALSVNVLDGNTGADMGTLNLGTITTGSGGTFAINMIGVADDGAIYVGNLTTGSATTNFKLYRWADEGAAPTLVYDGNPGPGPRFGDNLDVRGAGANTQILVGSRTNTIVAVFNTADGTNFTSSTITSAGAAGGDFGLGIAFGEGDTLWGKGSSGTTLRLVDLNNGSVLQSYAPSAFTNTFSPIGVDPVRNLLAGISIATPDALVLYDISNSIASSNTPVRLDYRVFPADNANANAVGSVEFGGGRLYALDANNGILAFNIVPEPSAWILGLVGAALIAWRRRR